MVVHWDGKFLPDLLRNTKAERIAILVSYNGTSKFLGAPKVPSATGENIAAAVHKILVEWNICDRVVGMCFDTTSSNTGPKNGAILHLQNHIDRKLINFACRHHTYELVLRGVFDLKFSTSSAPEVPTEIKDFCYRQFAIALPRDDYKELLQLTLMFLGEDVGGMRSPGPTSHARWMAKGIYDLKMFLFREQFTLIARELKGCRDVCIFFGTTLHQIMVWLYKCHCSSKSRFTFFERFRCIRKH